MNSVILLVEGDLDLRVLAQVVPNGVQVKMGEGKFDLSARIKGFRSASNGHVWGFRDRDFDRKIPESPSLEKVEHVFWAYRRTIENYLLIPENVDTYLLELPILAKSLEGRSGSELVTQAARDIRFYQAARAALGEIRERNILKSTWMKDSDSLPANLGKDSCTQEAASYLEVFRSKANQIADEKRLKSLIKKYETTYNDDFFNDGLHLIHFSGKNMCSAITRRYPGFTMTDFLDKMASRFTAKEFPDITDLVKQLSQTL